MNKVESFAEGRWHASPSAGKIVYNAVDGSEYAEVSSDGLDFQSMLNYGRNVGGPALRKMTFHERALMLKAIAKYLMERKKEFYTTSFVTGATKRDAWIDIDGGISTFFVYSSKGRRELPNETYFLDGNQEILSRGGTFVGHHLCVPLQGVAVHINAYNFPCWGMMEKLAPTFLAGVPAIVKPASVTSYVTEGVVRAIIDSGLLPEGALQLICGRTGNLLENVMGQDVVTFTGSAVTGQKLKATPAIMENSVRFNMEADSLNFSMLGPDVEPDAPEFALFIKELVSEMTIKSGQRCTAIRRTFVPSRMIEEVQRALTKSLSEVSVGDPAEEGVVMGPLVSHGQVDEVEERVGEIARAGQVVYGGKNGIDLIGDRVSGGSFHGPTVLLCDSPLDRAEPHDIEAFGPVTTLMPFDSMDQAIDLVKLGKGSLVGSIVTGSDEIARELVLGTAAYHGRIMVLNSECAGESTGHGSPLPHLVHGGPGRAGGGEEMGGIRGVMHYMQRTAIQGSPTTLSRITNEWQVGAHREESVVHPFTKTFDDLNIGDTLTTHRRTVTEADVVNFAGVSGDYFYAHTDEIAAKESLFEGRVAHGYFVLSAAAGLFVHPGEGPVLANYGLENLRFTAPVHIGDTIRAKLTCKRKIEKEKREGEEHQGVVEWHVDVSNQNEELVATYTILTLVRRKDS